MNTSLIMVSLMERLSLPQVIVGIVLASVGLATALIAKKFVKWWKQIPVVENNDKMLLIVKTLALVEICVALILLML